MDRALSAAIRRFPGEELAIHRLALKSESFRGLCGDLADAEIALDRWCATPSVEGNIRCDEYRLLAEDLRNEIEHFLRAEELSVSGERKVRT